MYFDDDMSYNTLTTKGIILFMLGYNPLLRGNKVALNELLLDLACAIIICL